jgi:caa(3)-type oxidase subunit IV
MAEEQTGREHEHPVLPIKLYIKIGVTLLILTMVTVAVAQIHLGAMNVIVAMFIAALKASLVVLFFMHLKYDSKLYMVAFVGAIVFLALFITFSMADTEQRGDIYEYRSEQINPEAVIYRNRNTAAGGGHHGEAESPDSSATSSTAETSQHEQAEGASSTSSSGH